jgi:uncharacterized membrane protein YdjX (TVP38/TMEM64 family)
MDKFHRESGVARQAPILGTRLWTALAIGTVAVAVALGGRELREGLGLGTEVASIRDWVHGFGWRGPVTFVGLVTFRQALFLPAFVLLTAGGVAFGAGVGTTLGTLGIVGSAAISFAIARAAGREWMPDRLRAPLHRIEARGDRTGLWLVALATAYPIGPMLAAHWAAGFSRLAATGFLVCVAFAGVIRAGILSSFGATLLAWGGLRSTAALAVLLVAVLLPLLHPRIRARLLVAPAPS